MLTDSRIREQSNLSRKVFPQNTPAGGTNLLRLKMREQADQYTKVSSRAVEPKNEEDVANEWGNGYQEDAKEGILFVNFFIKNCVQKIMVELDEIKESPEFCLPHLSAIKEILDGAADVLRRDSAGRIFSTLNRMIFDEKNWKKLSPAKINLLIEQLRPFAGGIISFDKIDNFSKQIVGGGVDILGSSDVYGEK